MTAKWTREQDALLARVAEGLRVAFDGKELRVTRDYSTLGPGLYFGDAAYLPHYQRNIQRSADAAWAWQKQDKDYRTVDIRMSGEVTVELTGLNEFYASAFADSIPEALSAALLLACGGKK